ncbi:MAG: type II toxin-antitoxin system VapC family toxin [Chloroflexota bacterium]|nr:type II toxin-antitoxin system VapC family toxin [Chloroflexota bacterium]
MSAYFFDTSALVKRYIPEKGTRWVRSILATSANNDIIVAQITSVEVISAVSARKRAGLFPTKAASAVRTLLDLHFRAQYVVIDLSPTIVDRAKDLLENHLLRAYDSIQLSTAAESNDALVNRGLPALTFVCADQRLLSVASTIGLIIVDPETYV